MKRFFVIAISLFFVTGCSFLEVQDKDLVEREFVDWSLDLGAMLMVVDPFVVNEYNLLDNRGFFVLSLESDKPASLATLKVYDVILNIGDRKVYDKASFCKALKRAYKESKYVPFILRRGAKLEYITIQLP